MLLNEADTRAKLIDPALRERGWTEEEHIRREETAGRIVLINGIPCRQRAGRTDYTLRIPVPGEQLALAVGVIEAKSERYPSMHGLDQGKFYAQSERLNVRFVFSSNGHQFVEFDRFTGITSEPKPMAKFPTPGELWQRYEQGMGFQLTDPAAKPLLTPYHGSGEKLRRYYQDAAIRAVFEKLAKPGEKRALLSLATGSGKTFIATHLLRRLADAGQLRKALFICDRKELREQGAASFQLVFGSDAAEVKDGNPRKNARVLIATYQTLDLEGDNPDARFLLTHYPENYFSHIIIDECHRSAWGRWAEVLRRNPNAIQIGLTATPRQIRVPDGEDSAEDMAITADNFRHFGQPVYEYDMAQGIEDGFLAACEVRRRHIILEANSEPEEATGLARDDLANKTLTDFRTGKPVAANDLDKLYRAPGFEQRLMLPDRVRAVARDFFDGLIETGGPEQKAIVFCASDAHADMMAAALNNLYAGWCQREGRKRCDQYAFKCTSESGGNNLLPDFKGARTHHFVATTVDLITTGVDVPAVRHIVFFRYLRSAILFYQMVGRGTRLDRASGKLMFRVWDYTNASRLFGKDFITEPPGKPGEGGETEDPPPRFLARGVSVRVEEGELSILTDVNGKAMPVSVSKYRALLAEKLLAEAATFEIFRAAWIDPSHRRELLDQLPGHGEAAETIRMVSEMEDYDLFDVLAHIAYGADPQTRLNRSETFAYANHEWLATFPTAVEATLRSLADQFAEAGTDALESADVFDVPSVKSAGGLPALAQSGDPSDILTETKRRLFAA